MNGLDMKREFLTAACDYALQVDSTGARDFGQSMNIYTDEFKNLNIEMLATELQHLPEGTQDTKGNPILLELKNANEDRLPITDPIEVQKVFRALSAMLLNRGNDSVLREEWST